MDINPSDINNDTNPENEMDSVSSETETPVSDESAAPVLPKKSKKRLIIVLISVAVVIIGVVVALLLYFNSDSYKYTQANELLEAGKYDQAVTAFEELGTYKDSKNQIIRCNRRKLYDYLNKKNSYTLYNADYTYELKPEDGNISIHMTVSELDFYIQMDMNSDNGNFVCKFSPYSYLETKSEGKCTISKLKSDANSLKIDKNTGYYNATQMKELADSTCDLTCMTLGSVLERLDLDITPADLGFTSIK